MLNGGCYCGAVRFEVDDAFLYAFYCHCSRCRRRTGAACAAIGGIEIDKVRIAEGRDQLLKVDESEDGYRCLCKRCFSPMVDVIREHRFAHVQLGTLSGAPARRPDHHIYVGSKAAWHSITDALPQFEELPP
ncbi:aldehyde-activating protein [Sorangium cellulosum]|uniref:Aldehyde-activating protein n=1 Tax=Sorangium cellulosum TaxID=56 RepID=A0A4P2QDG7_SORCE|nr:GFA family protein [Sorangium cellulosum]AUX27438.1 aldehyde-activating protein [Sorangium cellulosum]